MSEQEVFTVTAMNGQYLIEVSAERRDPWPDVYDAFTTGEDNWIAVITGTQHGPVEVQLAVVGERPEWVEPGWEMVGERDLVVESGPVLVHDLFSDASPHHLELEPGRYRVRVHVRGRDAASPFGILDEPVEHHKLMFYAAHESQGPATLVGPDEFTRNYR